MHLFMDRILRVAYVKHLLAAYLPPLMVAATLFGAFTACGFATISNTPGTGASGTGARYTLPTPTPEFDTSVQTVVIQFCQALSDGDYRTAYGYLSSHYKQTVTAPSQLANQLPQDGTIVGCMEFGAGHFIQVSGDHATDSVAIMTAGGPFGNSSHPAQIGLVKAGANWQINSIGQ